MSGDDWRGKDRRPRLGFDLERSSRETIIGVALFFIVVLILANGGYGR